MQQAFDVLDDTLDLILRASYGDLELRLLFICRRTELLGYAVHLLARLVESPLSLCAYGRTYLAG